MALHWSGIFRGCQETAAPADVSRIATSVLGRTLWSTLIAVAIGFSSLQVEAAAPQVVFDTSAVVAARDVTTAEFAVLNPGEKLIEIVWRVSILMGRGVEADLEEVVVTLQSPQRRGRVVDFWPRTELTHEFVGPIQGNFNGQSNLDFRLNLTGGWPVPASPLAGNLEALRSQHNAVHEQYQRLPPRTAVLASGTLAQGHGVFFKLRRWSQSSLEGEHEFRTVLAVPQAWRGDWVQVAAHARGVDQSLFGVAEANAGQEQFMVGVYLEADRDARLTVEKLLQNRTRMQSHAPPPMPKLNELLTGKTRDSTARQEQQQAVAESLRAVQRLSGVATR